MASDSPLVRRRPTRARNPQRNSNLVRASVLETALELGFGQNTTVANWIFNNPLSEEAEDIHLEPDNPDKLDFESGPVLHVPEVITPTYTSGSNSTSDESSSLNSPANNAPNVPVSTIQVHARKPSLAESPHVHFGDFSSDQLQLFSPLALSPHDAYRGETRGNLSGQLPTDSERSRSQDESLRSQDGPASADTGYTSEGQYLSKGKSGKGKTKPKKPKDKGSKHKSLEAGKNTEKDPGYASDGGYLSASSNKSQGKSPGKVKSRAMAFFRRRSKKSGRASDDEDEDIVPPVPAIPTFPRPSSPKPLERRAAPSSPTRAGFTPLTLNLTNPSASPPRRRVSKSPPPVQKRAPPQQQPNHFHVSAGPVLLPVASTSIPATMVPAATAAAFPLPPSLPGTPVSTTFPPVPPLPTQLGTAPSKPLVTSSSRQHLSIPPPAPPPTAPLPQLPPSPSTPSSGMPSPLPTRPATPSKSGFPTRPMPALPVLGPTRPLNPRRTASPLRPVISPRTLPTSASHARNGEFPNASEGDQFKDPTGRQRSASALSAGFGVAPAFLQRRMQHGLPSSPRHPPPDLPLPPSPCATPGMLSRTPVVTPSKFHEHFSSVSSVSSVPSPQVPSTPVISPSPSTTTLSEGSSWTSVRSSHISSISGRSGEPAVRNSENLRPTTSASSLSENGRSIPSTFGGRPTRNFKSQYSDRSDVSSSVYSQTMHLDSGSVTTYDADEDVDADVDDAASKSYAEDDDASVYPSDEKTAGRRTMYLMEHGELDGNGDGDETAEDHYWGRGIPPPLPTLPPLAVQPGPGYF